ncbi:MAG TPA: hypothetical protein VMH87_09105 [Pseudomonadales bacterium]|nr:hypothetical protein [Pseudomonadales bacterium]
MNRKSLFLSLLAGVLSFFPLLSSFGQGTAFIYQGQLGSSGAAANGSYDFQFTAYDAQTNGNTIGVPVINSAVAVSNGLLTTSIDFGTGVFTGPSRWLGIAVRTNGTGPFTPLFPTQPIQPVPYAIFANTASNVVGILPANLLSGGSTNMVALTNGANLFSGSFNGNGGALTNVNVVNLTGVLADNQLPTNTAFLNSNQTFTANNTFNGANVFTNLYGNSFSGSFFGNGLVGWVVVPGTTVQASVDHGYLLTNSQIVTVTLPATANPGDIVRVAGAGATGWQVAQNAGQSVLGNFITYGKTWTHTTQFGQWISIASSADGTRLVAANFGTGLSASVNSGATWASILSSPVQFVSVASSSDGTTLAGAVTNGGGIFVTTNSGSTMPVIPGTAGAGTNWTSVALSASGTQVFASAANLGLFVYTNKALEHFAAGAVIWSSVASSASGNNLAATVYNGGIYTSVNGGASWLGPFATTQNWRSITSSSDGTKLAAVVFKGGIYTSFDSGANWAITSAPATNWVSIASSSDGSKLVAVASGGDLYTSANWGQTWAPQTNSTPAGVNWDCVASSASGSTLAAGIYSSTSGGFYLSQAAAQTTSTVGTNGFVSGGQGSAAELIYVGNGVFMPVSSEGTIWGN